MNGPTTYPLFAGALRKDSLGNNRVRTEVYAGELVEVPFRNGQNGITGLNQGDYASVSRDGSNSYIQFTYTAASQWGVDKTIKCQFRGRVLGIRFDPGMTYTSNHFFNGISCMIDRVAYKVQKAIWDPMAQANLENPDAYYGVIVADDLCDGTHHLELGIRASSVNADDTIFYGLLCERRAGYHDEERYATACTPYAVSSASYNNVMAGFIGNHRMPRGLLQLVYYNTSGGSLDIYIRNRGVDYVKQSIAAGAWWSFSFPKGVSGDHFSANGFAHKASGSGLYCEVIGE